ncbi:adenosylcobinamide-GDP ribazoletransferase [Candidatus Nitrosarchaeum limnium]|nr:adenosylcobinamide-GDP ribazoletransferase [Candidatus Nitrosarchaeum limnium]
MLAAIITLIPLIALGGMTGLLLFGVGITLTMFLVGLTSRSFGGITGDIMGATNELTRLTSLLIFVSI